jgi:hypothetical protein
VSRRALAAAALALTLAGCGTVAGPPRTLGTPAATPAAPVEGIDPLDAMTWPVPDPELTPGSLTPGCTYPRKSSERNVTAATKRSILAAYKITDNPGDPYDLELDHLIPFSLCGANGKTNVWPQRYDGVKVSAFVRNRKDSLESYAARQVAAHAKDPHRGWTLAFAQDVFRSDWRVKWCQYRSHYASAGVKCPTPAAGGGRRGRS